MTGDRFLSPLANSKSKWNDFCLGRDVNLSSFIVDVINLGVSKNLNVLSDTGSIPWSINDTSEPPALVPLIVLTTALTCVSVPGVVKLIWGSKELNWWFCEIFELSPPNAFSSLKHNNEFPVLWFKGSKAVRLTSR